MGKNKEYLDEYTIICDRCNHTFKQKVIGLGYVNWTCPKCGKDDKTSSVNVKPGDPDFHKRKIKFGDGGALSANW